MTFKHLWENRLYNQIKLQTMWLVWLSFIAACGLGFLFHLVFLPVYSAHIREDELFRHGGLMVVYCGIGLLAGCSRFLYLHSQKKVDFYHSQPVSIMERFWVNVATDILSILPGIIVNVFVDMIVFRVNGIFSREVIIELILAMGFSVLAFSSGYVMAVLCTILTNHLIYTGLFLGLVILGPFMLAVSLDDMIARSMKHIKSSTNFLDYFGYINPINHLAVTRSSLDNGDFIKEILWQLFLIVVTVALAYIAFTFRNMERTSLATPIVWLKHVIRGFSMVVLICFTQALGYYTISSNFANSILYISICCILLYVIVNYIIELNFKCMIQKVTFFTSLAGVLLYLCIFFVCNYDLLGIDRYVPNPEKVKTVTLSVTQDWKNHNSVMQTLTCNEVEYKDVEAVCKMAKKMIALDDEYEEEEGINRYGFGEDVIDVTYHMKNGKTITRSYTYYNEKMYNGNEVPYLAIVNSKEFMESALPIVFDSSYLETWKKKEGKIKLEMLVYQEDGTDITDSEFTINDKNNLEEVQKLLAAYREDLNAQGDFSLYHPDVENTVSIYIEQSDKKGELEDRIHFEIPIGQNFTNTLAFLKEYIPQYSTSSNG